MRLLLAVTTGAAIVAVLVVLGALPAGATIVAAALLLFALLGYVLHD